MSGDSDAGGAGAAAVARVNEQQPESESVVAGKNKKGGKAKKKVVIAGEAGSISDGRSEGANDYDHQPEGVTDGGVRRRSAGAQGDQLHPKETAKGDDNGLDNDTVPLADLDYPHENGHAAAAIGGGATADTTPKTLKQKVFMVIAFPVAFPVYLFYSILHFILHLPQHLFDGLQWAQSWLRTNEKWLVDQSQAALDWLRATATAIRTKYEALRDGIIRYVVTPYRQARQWVIDTYTWIHDRVLSVLDRFVWAPFRRARDYVHRQYVTAIDYVTLQYAAVKQYIIDKYTQLRAYVVERYNQLHQWLSEKYGLIRQYVLDRYSQLVTYLDANYQQAKLYLTKKYDQVSVWVRARTTELIDWTVTKSVAVRDWVIIKYVAIATVVEKVWLRLLEAVFDRLWIVYQRVAAVVSWVIDVTIVAPFHWLALRRQLIQDWLVQQRDVLIAKSRELVLAARDVAVAWYLRVRSAIVTWYQSEAVQARLQQFHEAWLAFQLRAEARRRAVIAWVTDRLVWLWVFTSLVVSSVLNKLQIVFWVAYGRVVAVAEWSWTHVVTVVNRLYGVTTYAIDRWLAVVSWLYAQVVVQWGGWLWSEVVVKTASWILEISRTLFNHSIGLAAWLRQQAVDYVTIPATNAIKAIYAAVVSALTWFHTAVIVPFLSWTVATIQRVIATVRASAQYVWFSVLVPTVVTVRTSATAAIVTLRDQVVIPLQAVIAAVVVWLRTTGQQLVTAISQWVREAIVRPALALLQHVKGEVAAWAVLFQQTIAQLIQWLLATGRSVGNDVVDAGRASWLVLVALPAKFGLAV